MAFDGQPVQTLDDLHRALTEARIGTSVRIVVLRGADRREIDVQGGRAGLTPNSQRAQLPRRMLRVNSVKFAATHPDTLGVALFRAVSNLAQGNRLPRGPSNHQMTTSLADLRFALRGLRRSPLFSTVAILSLALGIGANTAIFTLIDQILLRKLPVKAPDELVMLYQFGNHMGSNMGRRMHSYPIYQDIQKRAEPLADVLCRRLVPASLSIDNRTERVEAELVSGNFFADAGGDAGPRAGVQLGRGRPAVSRSPGRRAQLRLLGEPVRARPDGPRQEDPGQRLSDDDRRRLGAGICGNRSGAVAADPRARAHEARDAARLALAPHGRSPGPMGAGVRTAEARLHGRVGESAAARAVHPGPDPRDDAAGGEGLVSVLSRTVHEGAAAGGQRGDGLFGASQRFFHGAARVDVHGRTGAADCVRQRGEPADRQGIHAAAGARGAAVARRVARTAGAAAARRESRAVVRGRAGRTRPGGRVDARSARARAVRRPAALDHRATGLADPRVHARPDVRDRHHLRAAAGASREPARSVDHVEGHRGIDRRHGRVAVPAQGTGRGPGGAQLPAAVRRRPVRPQPAEPEDDGHGRGARQPGDVPARARAQRLQRAARGAVQSRSAGAPAIGAGREVRGHGGRARS